MVRSIRRILEALTFAELEDDGSEPTSPPLTPGAEGTLGWNRDQFAEIRQRLAPLLDLEEKLISVLASPEEDEATQLVPIISEGAALPENYVIPEPKNQTFTPPRFDTRREVFVRSNGGSSAGWKKTLGRLGGGGTNRKGSAEPAKGVVEESRPSPEDPVHILSKCKRDMIQLWTNPGVQSVLRTRKLSLEESSGLWVSFPFQSTILLCVAFD